jgi:transposase-like protein
MVQPQEWSGKYPAIVRLWENAWAEFVPFLQFDAEIRRIVCTTNARERERAHPQGRPRPPAATSRTRPRH